MIMYNYYYIPAKKFSSREIRELLISVTVLTLAFAIAFSNVFFNKRIMSFLYILPVSLAAVLTGFFLHELGHKFVAQKYGCWAEFRMYPQGLLLALIISFFGFVFAAPGAVMIAGNVDVERNGKISAAGPLMNVLVALSFLPIVLLPKPSFIWIVCVFVSFINIMLAGFNMIPFPPLDGSKVFRWNKIVWTGMLIIIVIIALLVYPYYLHMFLYL